MCGEGEVMSLEENFTSGATLKIAETDEIEPQVPLSIFDS
jgi:hypothetical protein